MELLKILLDNYMITKEYDRDLYYDIKDNLKEFKVFIQDKLGYDVIIHPDFIKLEKFPGRVEGFMGIETFEDKMDYCLFILLIMFLEDKAKEEQFILSQLVEYITINFEEEKIDWTVYSNRKSIVRVLRFAIDLRIIKINDGDENGFANDMTVEALYENTGLSKYIIRSFPMDILEANSYRDFLDFAWDDIDTERGSLRRHRVYRTLTMSPALYNEGADDQDFFYVKQVKGTIEKDFEKFLNWKLHVHKDGAMIVLDEGERCEKYFPYNSAISDIVLCLNKMIREKTSQGILSPDLISNINMPREEFLELINQLREEKGFGWSKEYRECSENYLYESIAGYMKNFNMLLEHEDSITIRPIVGKVVGDYPKDFTEKENSRE